MIEQDVSKKVRDQKHPDFHTAKIEKEGIDRYEESTRGYVGSARQARDEALKKATKKQADEIASRQEQRDDEALDLSRKALPIAEAGVRETRNTWVAAVVIGAAVICVTIWIALRSSAS